MSSNVRNLLKTEQKRQAVNLMTENKELENLSPLPKSPSPHASLQNLVIETDPGAGLDQRLQLQEDGEVS